MINALYLIRRSSSEQEDNHSGDTQMEAILAYADKLGVDVVGGEGFIETGTGFYEEKKRPKFKAFFQRVLTDPGIDCLIVAKVDRFARSAHDLYHCEYLLNAAGKFLLVAEAEIDTRKLYEAETEIGELAKLSALAQVADMGRRINNSRMHAGKMKAKEKGQYIGGRRPYGYDVAPDKQLIPNHREQQVLKRMRDLYECGMSYCGIGRQLADEGYLNRHGRVFGHEQIKKLVTAA